ncbi:MAG: histone [Candidatus Huberarchaeum crystalense]|uniref:Histone n=1 Tax=Huberarchaeum crystalense TaxID=2014257 RepID=A0A2G9LK25_HUBC1|nr:MAG: histone [Candidatus Huberarchaeum crystalense]
MAIKKLKKETVQTEKKQTTPKKERKNLIIPESVAIRLFKVAGAPRVSKEARDALLNLIAKYGRDVAERAVKFSKHAKRQTITSEDIKLALE